MSWDKLQPWQKRILFSSLGIVFIVGILFLSLTLTSLYQDKTSEDDYWKQALTPTPEATQLLETYSANATKVTVGTYVENLKEINIKESDYRLDFNV